jgi:hypothetical protein
MALIASAIDADGNMLEPSAPAQMVGSRAGYSAAPPSIAISAPVM